MSSSKESHSVNWVWIGFKEHNNCGVITYRVDPQKQKDDKNTCYFCKIKGRYCNIVDNKLILFV